MFKSYVKTGPKLINRKFNKLTKGLHTDISFSTLKYPMFNWVIEDFHIKVNNNNIKIVPKNSFDKLTTVSLAFWIMDDGSFNNIKGNLTLCTDSYSREDVLYLISILRNKFHLFCGLINYIKKKTKSGLNSYKIRINKKSISYLIEIPYFIPSMLDKLGIK